MSETVVYGCDWCREIVPKDGQGRPRYAAHVTGRVTTVTAASASEDDICADCWRAFQALRQGRYRRG